MPGSKTEFSLTSTLLAQVMDIVKFWLESMKIYVEDGLVRLKNLIAENITAKKITADQLELKDRLTGSIYCVVIANGELEKTPGICSEVGLPQSTFGTSTIQLSDAESPTPSPAE